MHEKLKFSFGHILAFLSLLFIGYVVFMSVTYYTQCNYVVGGAFAVGTIVVLLVLLFCLQLLKSVNQDFEKHIVTERIILVLLTVLCGGAFLVYSHFWTVNSKKDRIEEAFFNVMREANQLFDDYQRYADNRLVSYGAYIKGNMDTSTTGKISSRVLLKGLQLQLLPQEYLQLKADVEDWVGQSEKSISVWNVFLVGNIENICNSMDMWHNTLSALSNHKMNDESEDIVRFNEKGWINTSTSNLMSVKAICSETGAPNAIAWITGIFAFFLLYLPWIIQKRSPKSMVTIFGERNITSKKAWRLFRGSNPVKVRLKRFKLKKESTLETRRRAQHLKKKTNGDNVE